LGLEGLGQSFLQFLELCGRHESVGHLVALLVRVIGLLDVSPDGDDTVQSWHLQDQVGIVRNCHEFGECRLSQEGIVHYLEVGYLELQIFSAEVFLSLISYGMSDLTDGGCRCSRDYTMERCTIGA
jgi:hypothetical protein